MTAVRENWAKSVRSRASGYFRTNFKSRYGKSNGICTRVTRMSASLHPTGICTSNVAQLYLHIILLSYQ